MKYEELKSSLQTLAININDGIAIIAFDRPEALNTLTKEMVCELRMAFEHIENEAAVRGVILTGIGDKAFMAGADVSEFASMDALSSREFAAYGQESICSYIENFCKPVIAAINGYALGGGNELAMCCDIRIASTKAVFAQPEASLGIMPIYGATKRLQRLVGFGIAKELIMTCRKVKAEEALQIGLVNKVAEPESLMETAKEMMQTILKNAPQSVYFSKIAMNRAADMSIEEAGELERDLAAILFATEDKKEGIDAFLHKRKAEFTER